MLLVALGEESFELLGICFWIWGDSAPLATMRLAWLLGPVRWKLHFYSCNFEWWRFLWVESGFFI